MRDYNNVSRTCRSLDSQPHGSRSISPVNMKPNHSALFLIMFPHHVPSLCSLIQCSGRPAQPLPFLIPAGIKYSFCIVTPRDTIVSLCAAESSLWVIWMRWFRTEGHDTQIYICIYIYTSNHSINRCLLLLTIKSFTKTNFIRRGRRSPGHSISRCLYEA